MSLWKSVSLVLALAVVGLSSSCCCCCSTEMLPSASFTPGYFADIPPYPGAEQRSGDDSVYGLVTLPFQFITDNIEWKHYVAGDSEHTILAWYETHMTSEGWIDAADMMEGTEMPSGNVLFFARAEDPTVMAVIMLLPDAEDSNLQHILIARLHALEE